MDARESALYAHPRNTAQAVCGGRDLLLLGQIRSGRARDGSTWRSRSGNFLNGDFGEVDIVFGMVDSVGSSR